MGHKIFSSVLFSYFYFLSQGVGAQNIQTDHQGDLRKTRHVN